VRPGRRLGVDRGLLIAVLIVGFVALALAKPWAVPGQAQRSDSPATTGLAGGVVPAEGAAPTLAALPPAVVYLTPAGLKWLTWPDVESSLAGVPLGSAAVAVLPGADGSVVSTALLDMLPSTQALGADCASAPLMAEGNEGFGLTLPRNVSAVSVVRIFARGGPLAVSASVSTRPAEGLALVALRRASWPVGHYTVVLDGQDGPLGYVPLCVGAYVARPHLPPILQVPATADAPAARAELWDEAQP
jgi:hypothetical protein